MSTPPSNSTLSGSISESISVSLFWRYLRLFLFTLIVYSICESSPSTVTTFPFLYRTSSFSPTVTVVSAVWSSHCAIFLYAPISLTFVRNLIHIPSLVTDLIVKVNVPLLDVGSNFFQGFFCSSYLPCSPCSPLNFKYLALPTTYVKPFGRLSLITTSFPPKFVAPYLSQSFFTLPQSSQSIYQHLFSESYTLLPFLSKSWSGLSNCTWRITNFPPATAEFQTL